MKVEHTLQKKSQILCIFDFQKFWIISALILYLRSKNLVTDRQFKVSLKSYQTPSYLLSYEKLVILTF